MKIDKRKKVFTVSTIRVYIPFVLPANAHMYLLTKSRRGHFKRAVNCTEGDIAWARIAQWFVPYEWSELDGIWSRPVGCLWGCVAAALPAESPIEYSSERTASSPTYPGMD